EDTSSSWPAFTQSDASVPPMCPAPMMPILSGAARAAEISLSRAGAAAVIQAPHASAAATQALRTSALCRGVPESGRPVALIAARIPPSSTNEEPPVVGVDDQRAVRMRVGGGQADFGPVAAAGHHREACQHRN